jgi:hypothetical protein
VPDKSSSASGSALNPPGEQQVKALTFITARRHFIEKLGEAGFEELIAPLDERIKDLFVSDELNKLCAEADMRLFMHRIYTVLAKEDDEAFCTIARELALAGVSRFFRVLMNLASARFVLKKVPVVWTRLRVGPATLRTEVEDDRIRIFYSDFVYCFDHVYRLLSMSNCQALVMAATAKVPVSRIVEWDETSMCLEFLLPGKHETPPESWGADNTFGLEG